MRNRSIIGGSFCFMILSVLLCWVPAFGPLIAGIVGGNKAGGIFRGIIAVLLPCIAVGVAFFMFAEELMGIPIVSTVIGLGSTMLLTIGLGPALVGAVIGGIMSH